MQAVVKSTALLFGADTKAWLSGFAALSSLMFVAAGAAAGCSWPYYAAATGAAAHMAWQIRTVDLDDGPDCMEGAWRTAKALGPGLAKPQSGLHGPHETAAEANEARTAFLPYGKRDPLTGKRIAPRLHRGY